MQQKKFVTKEVQKDQRKLGKKILRHGMGYNDLEEDMTTDRNDWNWSARIYAAEPTQQN